MVTEAPEFLYAHDHLFCMYKQAAYLWTNRFLTLFYILILVLNVEAGCSDSWELHSLSFLPKSLSEMLVRQSHTAWHCHPWTPSMHHVKCLMGCACFTPEATLWVTAGECDSGFIRSQNLRYSLFFLYCTDSRGRCHWLVPCGLS